MNQTKSKVDIKNYIQSFKQGMINGVVDKMGEGDEDSEHHIELIKLINNLSDEYIIASSLELTTNNEALNESVMQELVYILEHEMPF